MRIVSNNGHNMDLCIHTPYGMEEVASGGRQVLNEEMKKHPPAGFFITLDPVYDSDVDPRLKNDAGLKAEVDKFIVEYDQREGSKQFGAHIVKPETTVKIKREDLEELRAEAAQSKTLEMQLTEAREKLENLRKGNK